MKGCEIMSDEYFKMVLAIYLYNLTGNIPKENLIKNIMQNIRKQVGLAQPSKQDVPEGWENYDGYDLKG